jgi:hypothetical protein
MLKTGRHDWGFLKQNLMGSADCEPTSRSCRYAALSPCKLRPQLTPRWLGPFLSLEPAKRSAFGAGRLVEESPPIGDRILLRRGRQFVPETFRFILSMNAMCYTVWDLARNATSPTRHDVKRWRGVAVLHGRVVDWIFSATNPNVKRTGDLHFWAALKPQEQKSRRSALQGAAPKRNCARTSVPWTQAFLYQKPLFQT